MHRGVQALVSWLAENPSFPGVSLEGPATTAQLAQIQDRILSPLPADLRLILQRANGGRLPSGVLLATDDGADQGLRGTLDELAALTGLKPDDPEVPLPFFRTDDGGILAFDRTAGPVADTWPIIDYYTETNEVRQIHRTFDGWCRACVAEWTAPDFDEPFSLEKYLAAGKRLVEIEPDVSVAHATVAHALRRAGRPEQALQSYLKAARCVPALAWCDWEALKIAVLLHDGRSVVEAGGRLCARAPHTRWKERETTPGRVAEVLGHAAPLVRPIEALLRLYDLLSAQATTAEERELIGGLRHVARAESGRGTAGSGAIAGDLAADLTRAKEAFLEGRLRDDDLLLDPSWRALVTSGRGREVLAQARRF